MPGAGRAPRSPRRRRRHPQVERDEDEPGRHRPVVGGRQLGHGRRPGEDPVARLEVQGAQPPRRDPRSGAASSRKLHCVVVPSSRRRAERCRSPYGPTADRAGRAGSSCCAPAYAPGGVRRRPRDARTLPDRVPCEADGLGSVEPEPPTNRSRSGADASGPVPAGSPDPDDARCVHGARASRRPGDLLPRTAGPRMARRTDRLDSPWPPSSVARSARASSRRGSTSSSMRPSPTARSARSSSTAGRASWARSREGIWRSPSRNAPSGTRAPRATATCWRSRSRRRSGGSGASSRSSHSGRRRGCPGGISVDAAAAAAFARCPGCDVPMHPSMLYEIAFNLIAIAVILRYRDKVSVPGDAVKMYLVAAGVFRFLVEFVRGNEPQALGLTGPQWVLIPWSRSWCSISSARCDATPTGCPRRRPSSIWREPRD